MKPVKILKIFKKGARAASGKKGKAPEARYKWPSGVRIGVYGHANSGKSVYFTTLNEDCKVSKKLQISVTDSATAGEFLTNYRQIWGLDTTSNVGTVVDLRGEQKFPDPTEGERLLQFNAILDRSQKMSVVSYDYEGKAVSITESGDVKDKVIDFMDGAHGLIFFYDPKILGAELESQAHVASFVTMLERLAPLSARLPIPIALVVTKADILPGFTGENQTVLVSSEDEQFVSEEFEVFLEKVLSSNRIASNTEWAGSVRNVLVKLKEFLKIVVGRTLNFQIFFVSCTGQTPEKIGTDVGRSIYRPPKVIRPVGLQEPFYWILKSVSRNRSISRFRKVARFVATVSIIWAVVFSLPHLYHFKYIMPMTTKVEDNILEGYNGNYLALNKVERSRIYQKYDRYFRTVTVKWLFPKFVPVGQRISQYYKHFDIRDKINQLDQSIERFRAIVADPKLWPTRSPKDSSIVLKEQHTSLKASIEEFHVGDTTSLLYKRSGRTLWYWDKFAQSIIDPADTNVWSLISQQVSTEKSLYAAELSKAETDLMDVLTTKKESKVEKVVSKVAGSALEGMIDEINGNSDPEFRLDKAVKQLSDISGKLGADDRKKVNRYLSEAKKWKKRREFRYFVEKVPDDGTLYIEVTENGKDPEWSQFSPVYQDEEYTIKWKVGDDIHIGYCAVNQECNRGADPTDKIVLKSSYSLFDMERDLHFQDVDKHVTLRFKPSPTDKLPVLK